MKRLVFLTLALMLCIASPISQAEETLSADFMDFQVMLGDTVYSLPCPLADFVADGWEMKESTETLNPGQYSLSDPLRKDGAEVYVQLINLGIDVLPLSECLVGQISIDAFQAEKGAAFAVAGGIRIGSTEAEMLETLGQTGKRDSSSTATYTYEAESYRMLDIAIDLETSVVKKLTVRNFAAPEGYNDEAMAAAVEVPANIASYAPADALGDDPLSFSLSVDGKIITLPAAVPFMEEMGFTITSRDLPTKISAKDSLFGVDIVLGGYSMRTKLYNGDDMAQPPENCFVTTLRFDATSPFAVEIPLGIALGMTQDALDAAIASAGIEAEVNDSTSVVSYRFKKAVLEEVNLVVSKDTNTITSIEVQCIP